MSKCGFTYCIFSHTYHQSCFPSSSFSQNLASDLPSSSGQKPERHSSMPSSPNPIATTSGIYLNWFISLPSYPNLSHQDLLSATNKEIFHTPSWSQPRESTFHTAAHVIFERRVSAVTPCKLLASLTWLRPSHALLLSALAALAFRVLSRSTLRALHMCCMCLACLPPTPSPLHLWISHAVLGLKLTVAS